MHFTSWYFLLSVAFYFGMFVSRGHKHSNTVKTQDLREEDLNYIDELENGTLKKINLKEIEGLLSTTFASNSKIKNTRRIKSKYVQEKPQKVKQTRIIAKNSAQKGKKSHAKTSSNVISSIEDSRKKIIDFIKGRLMSNKRYAMANQSRAGERTEDKMKMERNESGKLAFSNTVKAVPEKMNKTSKKSPNVSKNLSTSSQKLKNDRDSSVFRRLENIAHYVLKALKQNKGPSNGSKIHYQIHREDLLTIGNFIKTTRNSSIARDIKVQSARKALFAIKNLLQIVKKKSKNSRIVFGKWSMNYRETGIKNNQLQLIKKISSNNGYNSKQEQDSLSKLVKHRIKRLKQKLLKALTARHGKKLHLDIKKLKSKLKVKTKQWKRDKREVGTIKKNEILIDKTQQKKSKNVLKHEKMIGKVNMFHNIKKQLRHIIQQEFDKIQQTIRKTERKARIGTKRFFLAHGAKSFRKNLISLANIDATKMSDKDLKKLHDQLNEWIAVEEKLERKTKSDKVKENQTNDSVPSSIKRANSWYDRANSPKDSKGQKENGNLEIIIDIKRNKSKEMDNDQSEETKNIKIEPSKDEDNVEEQSLQEMTKSYTDEKAFDDLNFKETANGLENDDYSPLNNESPRNEDMITNKPYNQNTGKDENFEEKNIAIGIQNVKGKSNDRILSYENNVSNTGKPSKGGQLNHDGQVINEGHATNEAHVINKVHVKNDNKIAHETQVNNENQDTYDYGPVFNEGQIADERHNLENSEKSNENSRVKPILSIPNTKIAELQMNNNQSNGENEKTLTPSHHGSCLNI
ncbi:uncharacterized protein LOC124433674 [Xenia sp. Carnegie-2017]|uniref:uncharacterized protein LOC124433674 n=1 Tax=Xenia sp. Carnegie-2017 TaxID=2897299 RepID=UPI001F0378E2|nr:uncharacterized protein LOC124433674 [Xenia sp. Carnegie-2017]